MNVEPVDQDAFERLIAAANAHSNGRLTILKFDDHWCIGLGISINVLDKTLIRAESFAEAVGLMLARISPRTPQP